VQAGLSVTPASANFGSVVTGNTNSQTLQVKNIGTASLSDFASDGNGFGFGLNGMALPMTLTPGQSGNFNVQYAPQTAGNSSGSISIVSNAPNSPATVALSGTGVSGTFTISVVPSSLSFGSITDGTSTAQGFTVTNTGTSNVAISGMTATERLLNCQRCGSGDTVSASKHIGERHPRDNRVWRMAAWRF
jgi:hypothetical protein